MAREQVSGDASRRALRPRVALWGCLLLAACSNELPDGAARLLMERADQQQALAPGNGSGAVDMVQRALVLHPDVRQKASLISAGIDQIRVERAAMFPSLGISLIGGFGTGGRGDPDIELGGQQMVMDFGRSKRAVKGADIELQISYLTFQKSVDAAAVETLTAYDDVNRLAEVLAIRREQLAEMQRLEALLAERIEAGATSAPDLLEARKRLQQVGFTVHDAELRLAEARDNLQRLTGLPKGGPLPALGGSCVLPQSGTDNLRMAKLQQARAILAHQEAERARLPRISLNPLASKPVAGGDTVLGVNVSVGSDLLQGGAISARARAAKSLQEASAAAVEAAQREETLTAHRLQRQIASGQQRMKMLTAQIALLTEVRELYRSQYFDLGTRQITDLLDNEDDFYTARAGLVETRSEIALSRVECAAADHSLRSAMQLEGRSLYGFPLAEDPVSKPAPAPATPAAAKP
ncbi:TolC family protein [Xinfangfangia sp. D13-10-4-6]|uniref:TolC family protein n=1 Tax=Pseudogemmobacter hezensis TaxID=2737662 RepID=UPI001552DBCE|nr:TolC family protein [Pseudogemmobacter hezensis]NPD17066.1 TolC family protein [Pseudogemmobacter hezensis]